MCVECFLRVFAYAFVEVLANALTLAIFVRVILSWIRVELPLGLGPFVFSVTEPILGPIRRALPAMGGMDFSPFLALLLLQYIARPLLLGLIGPPV